MSAADGFNRASGFCAKLLSRRLQQSTGMQSPGSMDTRPRKCGGKVGSDRFGVPREILQEARLAAISVLWYVAQQMQCSIGFVVVACHDRRRVGCLMQFCRQIFDDCMVGRFCNVRTRPASARCRTASISTGAAWGAAAADWRIEQLLGDPETKMQISAGHLGHLQLGALGGLRLLALRFSPGDEPRETRDTTPR